jgi:hypothetical protein
VGNALLTLSFVVFLQGAAHFSWLREFLVPAFFTLFGAILGFVVGHVTDKWKASDAKESFLRAVGMELDALGNQLDGSIYEVQGAADRVAAGHDTGPQFSFAFRTSVFTSQIGKLQDVADPLLIEVVHFYSDFGTLESVLNATNEVSAEFTRAPSGRDGKERIRPRLKSTLIELDRQFRIFGDRLNKTRRKLPPAEESKEG